MISKILRELLSFSIDEDYEYINLTIRFLGCRLRFKRQKICELKLTSSVIPLITTDFKDYIKECNLCEKISNLKAGLDDISKIHVDFMINVILNFPSAQYKDFFFNKPIEDYSYPPLILEELKKAQKESQLMYQKGYWGGLECVYYHHGLRLLDFSKKYIENKLIFDLGAFDGDSSCILSDYNPSEIYAFEISNKNIQKYKQNMKLKNIQNYKIFNIALSNYNGTKFIKDEGTWSDNLTESGKEPIKIQTLDDFYYEHQLQDEIGFIKADIEGDEPNMLDGAIEIIKKFRPIISVSIYHDPISFFEIKEKIEKMNLNYDFYIRQFGFYDCGPINEATLIAYPKELKERRENKI